MLTRYELIMQVTTAPANPTAATQRTGGWSEGFWSSSGYTNPAVALMIYAQLRSNLLPKTAAVVGWRSAGYTISGNKLLPQGTSGGKFFVPGFGGWTVDVPQAALEIFRKCGGPHRTLISSRSAACLTKSSAAGNTTPWGPFPRL